MKKKIASIIAVVFIAAIGGYNVYTSHNDVKLSDLMLVNVEALARYELPDVDITCNTGGSGQCYYVAAEEGLFGACRFDCEYSGDTTSSCSSCWVDFVNFCSAFATACGG